MWNKKFMGVVVALGLVLAACTPTGSESAGPTGSQPEASTAPAADQVLKVNMSQEPGYLDPTYASTDIEIEVLRQITYPLAYFDPDLNLVPGLADSWEVSDDGLTITYHLGDHQYSNGDDIVADDFVYSWRKLADPRTPADYSYVLEPVDGWSEIQDLGADTTDADLETLGVAAPDDKTFVVTLHDPSAYMLYIGAMWLTVPLRPDFVLTEAEGYVSSGPFIMTEWRHQSNIVLEVNPNWKGDERGGVTRIEMAMINNPTAALVAYEAGELDESGVPRAEVNRARTESPLKDELRELPALNITYFGFDMKNPNGVFAQSLNMRKAFNESIDKDTMLAAIFSNIGVVAYSAVPPGMQGHSDEEFYPYDTAQAVTDFNAGLAELGITKDELQIQIGYNEAGTNADLVAFFQAQYVEVFGLDTSQIELVPTGLFSAYLAALEVDPPDIFRLGWGADYPHPQNFLYDLFNKDSGNNYMGYNSPAFEDLMLQARSATNTEDSIALYSAAQEQLMADLPFIPQSYGALFTVVKPWVQNLTPTSADSSRALGEYFYYKVTIAEH